MNVEIREATEQDLDPILSLYGQIGMDNGKVLPLDEAENLFTKIKSYPDYKFYAVVDDKHIIGTFSLLIMDNLAHMGAPSGILEDVVVREDFRRRGIGRLMMNFAMERCRERGCYKIALSCNMQRESAHFFYEALDFKRHGYSFVVDLAKGDLC
jgi:GNAT superfamily N-acetyltransferase